MSTYRPRYKNDLKALLDLVNWQVSGDPYFYEHYHLTAVPLSGGRRMGGEEYWIFYGSSKFD